MEKFVFKQLKLGIFISTGLVFLIFLFYYIGKNRSMFGGNFTIKSRFDNVQGLQEGNNVRYAGIDIGTVKKINVINDTTLEVNMSIKNNMKNIIKKNSMVTIGTDGLVGNKVVNISSVRKKSEWIENNDLLISKKPIDTDDMLRTLFKTNNDIAVIAENLKQTIYQINQSSALWSVLNDNEIPNKIHSILNDIKLSSHKAKRILTDVQDEVVQFKKSDGIYNLIIKDTIVKNHSKRFVENINEMSANGSKTIKTAEKFTNRLYQEFEQGNGILNKITKDSAWAALFNTSLKNMENSTSDLKLTMEAIQHSFLFRNYFKKLNKKKNE